MIKSDSQPCKDGRFLGVYIPTALKKRIENYTRGRMPIYHFVREAIEFYFDVKLKK